MVAGVLGQEIIAEIVLGRGGGAVPSLELADDEFREIGPVRRGRSFRANVIAQGLVVLQSAGGIQVTGMRVIQGRDVG